ncbi:hypothetical protein [Psychrobacillus sp.]|nr:hypothetical protein [Psychrobacillus sp.]
MTLGNLERQDIIFQLMMNTRMTEQALNKMSNEKLIEMYKAKVEVND